MAAKVFAGNRDRMHTSRIALLYEPIDSLKPDPKNARKHSKKQTRQIARSVDTFGFNNPVLIDAERNIIAGHARVEAAKQLGLTEVPAVRLPLTGAAAKAYALADNKLALNATWDMNLLGDTFRELDTLKLDFGLGATGFEIAEIDSLMEETAPKTDSADEIPAPQPGPAIAKPGDLWFLGPHRVHCASATEESAYQVLMGEERAAAIFADPPYNVRIDGHASGLGAIHHREFAMASGEMDERTYTDFLAKTCNLLVRYSADGSLHYICMDWRHLRELLEAARVYSELKNICVWAKDGPGMGSFYRSQHEFILVCKNGRAPHRNNVQLGKHGRNRSNLWNYPCARSFSRASDEGNLMGLHPTVKPVRLVADALLDSTARGDIVLDAFLGSGTTLIAAERVRRRCYALEIDPLYLDTSIRRWQSYTGDSATHAATGQSFDEISSTLGEDR